MIAICTERPLSRLLAKLSRIGFRLNRHKSGAIFLAFLLASVPAPAQGPEAAQAPPATLRSETHAILISVSVRDSGGHAVENLRKEDFTVSDNGTRRDFQVLARDASPAQRPVTLPAGVFTNRFGAAAPTGR